MAWCHECEKEYTGGETVCPVCGADLYENIPPSMMEPEKIGWGFGSDDAPEWPNDENGEPEEAVFLMKAVGSETEIGLTVAMLNGSGIPVKKDYPNDGRFMRMLFGFAGTGASLYVPASMLEDAKALTGSEGV